MSDKQMYHYDTNRFIQSNRTDINIKLSSVILVIL